MQTTSSQTFHVFLWSEDADKEHELVAQIMAKFPFLAHDTVKPDYVFCFGGDGTFLLAMKKYAETATKLIFINAGHLGFLANYSTLNGVTLAETYEPFDLMHIKIGEQAYTAINEMTLYSAYTNEFALSCNGIPFYKFRGSGCSITTMIGSTGLNRSNHGPLLMTSGLIFSETSPLNYRNDRGIGQDLIFDRTCHLELNTTNYQQKLQIQFDHEMLTPKIDSFEIWLELSRAQIIQSTDLKTRIAKIQRTFF